MKCNEFKDQLRAISGAAYAELIKAVEAHGGAFDFVKAGVELPQVMAVHYTRDGEPYMVLYRVTKVSLYLDGLRYTQIFGVYDEPLTYSAEEYGNEITEDVPGYQYVNITLAIPSTEKIDSVAMPL